MFKKIFGFILGVIFFTGTGFYLFMMALWGDMGAPPTAHASTSGDYSKGQLRSDCEAIPENKRYLIPVINFAGETFKVSPALVSAMIKQESNFGAGAVSSVGAQGLMQVMPGTRAEMSGSAQGQAIKTGFHIIAASTPGGFNFTDPLNEATSIFFGTRYISQQITTFNKVDLALAAYNAGPGAVQSFKGIPPYTETINYVKNITESLPEFEKCLTESSSSASEKLKKWVNENPQRSCQFTTDVTTAGSSACYRTARGVMDQVFPGNRDEGNMYSRSSHDPNQQDLDNLKNLLSQDKIPVLQVRGDASGQHWIAVTGVKGSSVDNSTVEFYDPATGRIEARQFNSRSGSRHGGYYFGINTTQSTDINLRGIIIEPND